MLSQIIRQCSLFDVDISRELNRPIFNSKKIHFWSKKGEKGMFFKMFLFHQFPIPQVSIISNMTEESLLDKHHTPGFSLRVKVHVYTHSDTKVPPRLLCLQC